jgi:hypothetical protein
MSHDFALLGYTRKAHSIRLYPVAVNLTQPARGIVTLFDRRDPGN